MLSSAALCYRMALCSRVCLRVSPCKAQPARRDASATELALLATNNTKHSTTVRKDPRARLLDARVRVASKLASLAQALAMTAPAPVGTLQLKLSHLGWTKALHPIQCVRTLRRCSTGTALARRGAGDASERVYSMPGQLASIALPFIQQYACSQAHERCRLTACAAWSLAEPSCATAVHNLPLGVLGGADHRSSTCVGAARSTTWSYHTSLRSRLVRHGCGEQV